MNWNQLEVIFSNISFLLLFFGMVTYWINLIFFNLKKINFVLNLGRSLTINANIFLFLTLCSRWIVFGYFPLSNLYESLLFLTWLLITISIYGEFKTKSRLLGALLIPVALFINGFANLCLPEEMQQASPLVPALQSNWLMLHVTMMLSSYGLLISGSLCCILFLMLSELKELNFTFIDSNNIEKSPKLFIEIMIAVIIYRRLLNTNLSINLETYNKIKVNYLLKLTQILLLQMLENFTYRIIGLGFPSLTIGIIAGGVWANEAWGSYWSWDPKETWAFITWSIFAIYLHVRYINGWKGLKLAYIGSSGFFIIWICYLGVNFLGKGLHSYGWIGQ